MKFLGWLDRLNGKRDGVEAAGSGGALVGLVVGMLIGGYVAAHGIRTALEICGRG